MYIFEANVVREIENENIKSMNKLNDDSNYICQNNKKNLKKIS